jgi:hypothetical protein
VFEYIFELFLGLSNSAIEAAQKIEYYPFMRGLRVYQESNLDLQMCTFREINFTQY